MNLGSIGIATNANVTEPFDLRWAHGRIYYFVNQDENDTQIKHRWWDIANNAFGFDTDSGGVEWAFQAEECSYTRVLDGDLIVPGLDGVSGNQPRVSVRSPSSWRRFDVATGTLNGNTHGMGGFKFAGKFFNFTEPTIQGNYPAVMISYDGGNSYTFVDQSATWPGTGITGVGGFIPWKGKLYVQRNASTPTSRYLSKYSGDPHKPFTPLYNTAAAFGMPTGNPGGTTIFEAWPLKHRVLFRSGQLNDFSYTAYTRADPETAASCTSLGSASDVLGRFGVGYTLRAGSTARQYIVQRSVDGGLVWSDYFQFTLPSVSGATSDREALQMEVTKDHFYFAVYHEPTSTTRQRELFRVPVTALTGHTTFNTAPVAVDDSFEVDPNVTLSRGRSEQGVLANDTDEDLDPYKAVLVAAPTQGTLTFNANGSFTYVPPTDWTGATTFTYKVNDQLADSNVATVTINVKANAQLVPPTYATDGVTTHQFENLTRSGHTNSVVNDATASGGSYVLVGPTTGSTKADVGKNISVTIPSIPAGTYDVWLRFRKGDHGMLRTTLDGNNLGGTREGWRYATGWSEPKLGQVTFSSAATHTLKLFLWGKHASATQWTFAVDKITFVPVTTASAVLPEKSGVVFASAENERWATLHFKLAATLTTGQTLEVQAADSLAPADWTALASKTGSGPWLGTAPIWESPEDEGSRTFVLHDLVSADGRAQRFYRCTMTLQ